MTLSELKQKYKPMTLFELAKLDITEAERKDYERKLDYIARMEDQIETAKVERIEKGIEIGIEKQQIKTVIKGFKKGSSIEFLMEITDLSETEINEILKANDLK